MNKPLLVMSCPIDTFSGYGARSRDIAKAIINSDKYEVKILPQRWGHTPMGFLNSSNPSHLGIINCLHRSNELPRKPDVWIQVTVPNEFRPIGSYNIGITAGIETTICDASWIDGVNRMNLTLVSSEHAKKVFEQSIFDKTDNMGNILGRVELEPNKIEVLFEGFDNDIFDPKKVNTNDEVTEIIDTIPEQFCFLFVGHWLQGELGQDRKDVGMMIKTFLETFKDRKNQPALILKTCGGTFSIMDKNDILRKIDSIRKSIGGNLPKIYLLHGELSDSEMAILYYHPKVKAMISFTKGEGYGRPLLEFTTSQKPVIAPAYSGHTDFLNPHSIFLEGKLENVHPSAVVPNMILPESQWFTVDYNKASRVLDDVFKNYNNFLDSARKQSYLSKKGFSLEVMSNKLLEILDRVTPQQVELVLPKLPIFKKVK